MKTCGMCKVDKVESDFSKNASRKDGLNPRCKSCIREYEQTNKRKAYMKVYEIPPQQLSLLRECLRQIESGREFNIMQANGRPHGANAMMADTIEA